jgi:hypothetical protein
MSPLHISVHKTSAIPHRPQINHTVFPGCVELSDSIVIAVEGAILQNHLIKL